MADKKATAEKSAEFAAEQIEFICRNFDKRAPGSEGELAACGYVAENLKAFSDDVKVETFKVYPDAFMGWIPITITCLVLGYATYFFAAMVSMMFIVISLIPMILEFVLYKRFMDPLYPEKQSNNITAVRKCGGEVKKRIFLCANIDAVWEWRTNYVLGGKVFITQIVLAFIGVGYLVAIDIARWVFAGEIGATLAQGEYLYMGLAALVFVPSWVCAAFLSNKKMVVDGANDNLSGTAVCMSVMKALEERGIHFENTEVGVIITGSKQAGLRGAKAYGEEHKNDFKDAETVFITLDTLREANFLQVNVRDMNNFVRNDAEVSELFVQGAKNAGVRCSKSSVPFGATDSAAYTLAGFKSTVVTAIDHNLPKYYHTRYDSFDNISKDCLKDAFSAVMETVFLFGGEQAAAEKYAGEQTDNNTEKSQKSDTACTDVFAAEANAAEAKEDTSAD